jgi:hypothetical protein
MNKRLILILALAFVVGIAFAAYAEVQNVKVSGDLNMSAATRNLTLQGPKNNNDTSFFTTITRVKVDADLTDNVIATVRILNERYWGLEKQYVTDNEDSNAMLVLDLAYATLKEFLYSPLTLMIGRQELHYGSQMIVGDPDTNNRVGTSSAFALGEGADPDLTARKAFDAIRAVLNYDPLVIDVVFAKINNASSETAGTPTIADDDTRLMGVSATYALNKKTTAEGYLFQKTIGKKASSLNPPKGDEIDTIGARIVSKPLEKDENLTTSLEMAYQFGKVVDSSGAAPRKAWALEAGATYALPKMKMTPTVTTIYSYFSGDHVNNTYDTTMGTYKGWDPMYENQTSGAIANALFDQTNVHIAGGIVTAKPVDDVTLKGEYYAYWWAKAYPENSTASTRRGSTVRFTERRFAGQEIDLTAMYDYTEDVQFSLMGGMFMPGPAIAKANSGTYQKVASEVIGSMKVSF